MAINELSEDELNTRRTIRTLRAIWPVAVVGALLAAGVVFVTQSAGASSHSSESVVELTDDRAAGISVGRNTNDALQEIEAQLVTVSSAVFRDRVSAAVGAETAATIIGLSASNRDKTPVIVLRAQASTAAGAEAAAAAMATEFTAIRVESANESLERELVPLQDQRTDQLALIDSLAAELDGSRSTATADEISILENRVASALSRLDQYDQAIQEREFLIRSAGGEVRLVNGASPASVSTPSSLARPLQFGLVAFVLILLASIVLDRVRGRLYLLDDVRAVAGPDVPVLATVPRFRRKFSRGSSALVVGRRNARREAEAFRFLRTAIDVAADGMRPLTVAITSASANEGKSVTAGNYALALARSGRAVGLLDGDLLNSTVSHLFDADGDNAFLAVVNGDIDPSTEEWFHYPTSGVPVDVLVSERGSVPTSRQELVSDRVEAVYGKLGHVWETVVVDCPPVLAVSDSMVLAGAADLAILIVRVGKTTRRELDKALTQLEQSRVRLGGIVVTYATAKAESYYGYGNNDD